jgi:hypothetical protein
VALLLVAWVLAFVLSDGWPSGIIVGPLIVVPIVLHHVLERRERRFR